MTFAQNISGLSGPNVIPSINSIRIISPSISNKLCANGGMDTEIEFFSSVAFNVFRDTTKIAR